MRQVVPLLIAVSVWIGACSFSDPDASRHEVEIRTDREQYVLGQNEDPMPVIVPPIHVTLRNYSTGTSIYYKAPAEWKRLEKQVGGSWVDLGVWYWLLPIAPRVYGIGPGEALDPVVEISPLNEIFESPGTYRFVFDLYSDADARHLLPLEKRVSNSFEIVRD
jgi:hypothetical protein